jgi:hypothetical protein
MTRDKPRLPYTRIRTSAHASSVSTGAGYVKSSPDQNDQKRPAATTTARMSSTSGIPVPV